MLVKLAFVMQRFKKYLKNFCHDQQRWERGTIFRFYGGQSCYEGDIELMGGVPQCPPLGKTLLGVTLHVV